MPFESVIPEGSVLVRWRDEEGLSLKDIQRRVNEQNALAGIRPVSYSAISERVRRAGGATRENEHWPWGGMPRYAYSQRVMHKLRLARRQARGQYLTERQCRIVEKFKADLAANDVVVHYSHTLERFQYVPRRHGIDNWLIREPDPEHPMAV